MERRPILLSSVMLRQNPHNVHEWHKRVKLFNGQPHKQILTYTEAVTTVNVEKVSAHVRVLSTFAPVIGSRALSTRQIAVAVCHSCKIVCRLWASCTHCGLPLPSSMSGTATLRMHGSSLTRPPRYNALLSRLKAVMPRQEACFRHSVPMYTHLYVGLFAFRWL